MAGRRATRFSYPSLQMVSDQSQLSYAVFFLMICRLQALRAQVSLYESWLSVATLVALPLPSLFDVLDMRLSFLKREIASHQYGICNSLLSGLTDSHCWLCCRRRWRVVRDCHQTLRKSCINGDMKSLCAKLHWSRPLLTFTCVGLFIRYLRQSFVYVSWIVFVINSGHWGTVGWTCVGRTIDSWRTWWFHVYTCEYFDCFFGSFSFVQPFININTFPI